MTAAARSDTMGLREFAAHLKVKPGYVTQLKEAGRLVLSEDGRRVRVAESIALIEATRDPAKVGVTARHAAARAQAATAVSLGQRAAATGADSADDETPAAFTDPVADSHARRRAKALADKEEALARKQLRDEQIELKQLLRVDEVLGAIADAATTLRTSLETLPATLAPELAATSSEDRIRVLLGDAIEARLGELARKFGAIGRAEA